MILALAGGVGGAKLANGLTAILSPDDLTIVVNTGDDFEHFGLTICPDIDSVCYKLAGINNVSQGWGLEGESWAFMDAMGKLGGETWFNLGDRDIATHVTRTQMLRKSSLSEVTAHIAGRLGIRHPIAPMSDDPIRSIIDTDEGWLAFQRYFVERRAQPRFRSIVFEGVEKARPSAAFLAALSDPALEMIVICPSNPVLSIAPILAVPGIREKIAARRVPVVAVSPFIGGQAVKGPAAKIMEEMGQAPTTASLATYYGDLVDGIVMDRGDSDPTPEGGPALLATDTMMHDADDEARLARETIAFGRSLSRR